PGCLSQAGETVKVSANDIIKKFIHHEEHEGNEEKEYKINNLILHALHGYFVILNTFTASGAWERAR
ncbi:MAG TPA: hypothetical protein DCZ48_12725, partial [Methylococcaceae bacterium]|nr:hypothetical protein [Methylococcaceae bacterium]